MGVLDQLFGRNRSGEGPAQGLSGMVRIGSSYYNAKWNFTRVLNEVYANPTGYRCVNTIADDFSRPPWAVYADESPTTPADDPKAKELLAVLNKPDKMLSGTGMQRQIAMDRELNGRSFWVQLRDTDRWGDAGKLTGLKRLPCENVTVVTNFDRDLLGFVYTTDAGQRVPLLPGEVLYTHCPHPQNPWEGFPPAYIAGLPANVDDKAMRFNWRLLENDGALPGIVTVDGLAPEDFQKFKAIWQSQEEPGRTRFLKGGAATYTKTASSNKEMMQDLLRAQSQQDIAVAFGMSPLVINPSEATFANGNVARVNYMSTKIGSMWANVADQWTTQIQDDYPGYRIGFDLGGIEELGEAKDDLAARSISLYSAGLKSDDEARADLGLGPKAEATGTFRSDSIGSDGAALSQLDQDAEEETKALPTTESEKAAPPQPVQKAVDDWSTFDKRVQAYEEQAARKMSRFFAKQGRVIAATIRSRRGKSMQKALDNYFDRSRWNAELGDDATDMYSDVIDSFGTWTMANLPTAKKFDATHERVTDYIQGRSTKAAGLVNNTTEEQLRASIDALEAQGLGVDEIAKGVEDYFSENAEYRAQLWAKTEVISASNYSQLEAARQSDVVRGKYWILSPDACPECQTNEGDGVIGLDDMFSTGDDEPVAHPACRCAIGFDTDSQDTNDG